MDHGFRSKPACALGEHSSVKDGPNDQRTGGREKWTLDFDLSLLYPLGVQQYAGVWDQ